MHDTIFSLFATECPEQCMTCTFDSAVGKTECSTCNDGFKLTDVKTCQGIVFNLLRSSNVFSVIAIQNKESNL